MRNRNSLQAVLRGPLVLLVAIPLLGCGPEAGAESARLPVSRVTGRLTYRGEPAVGARILLHPTDPATSKAGLVPHGTADASGRFTLTTYEQGDGAPAGQYRATVTWPVAGYTPKTREEREELLTGGQPPDRLKGRYARPERTTIEVAVPAGNEPHELPVIELR